MSPLWLVLLGTMAGTGAGLLAGLVGIGGGIVVVPVVYYGLIDSGLSVDQAVHIAVATSLAAILQRPLSRSWRTGGPVTPISASCVNGALVSPLV